MPGVGFDFFWLAEIVNGTCIAPHRHRDPPKPESFIVLEGGFAFFMFGEFG